MTTLMAAMHSCKIEEGVALVTLNHPPVNALTPEMLTELEGTFDSLAMDEAVKIVVLTGAGRFFVAGADIRSASLHLLFGRRRSDRASWADNFFIILKRLKNQSLRRSTGLV